MTPEQSQLLAEYRAAQAAFTAAKEHEQTLRTRVVALLGSPEKLEGTERVNLGQGEEAVLGKRLNYKVNNENGQVKWLEAIMPPEVFNDVFKITYDLSITAYRKLTSQQKTVIDYALTITEGMPTLKIEPTSKVI